MLHVHVNHGESDKQSMASNNAKAYDRVFVAGEAAVERHRAGLMEFDPARLVRVGRPQLDLHPGAAAFREPRRTVLYAPTWEGDADYNDYSSVDVYGPDIVALDPGPSRRTPGLQAAPEGHHQHRPGDPRRAPRDPGRSPRPTPASPTPATRPSSSATSSR